MVVILQFVHETPLTTASLSPPPNASGVHPDPVTITLGASAAPGYTVAFTRYRVDGGEEQTYGGPFLVSGEGPHTLEYWSVDDAGVYEVPKTSAFTLAAFGLAATGPARLWVGLKNSDDQGTRFDVAVTLYVNETLVAQGSMLCVAGITRNPAKAIEVTVPVDLVAGGGLAAGDALSLKVLTRIGTNPDGSKCPGHANAVGLRLYYDAVSRPSRFGAEITPGPPADQYLRSTGGALVLDTQAPTSSLVRQKDSGPVNFAAGNPWTEIGTWSRVVQ
jgi:hypothetical protein